MSTATTFNYVISDAGNIFAIINGRSFNVAMDHPNYAQVKQAVIDQDVAAFVKAADIARTINKQCRGKVEVRDGVVYYNDQAVHGTIAQRILEQLSQGFPIDSLCLFLENLMQNPSMRARNELYGFLTRRAHYEPLPITTDGCFLAYKSVRSNYLDHHTGTFDNTPGQRLSMPRQNVDDDCQNACSYGFHVGSLTYVTDFGGSDKKVVVVKVNPADVVSIPIDADETKCRVCTYEFYDYEGVLVQPYTTRGQNVYAPAYDETMTMINDCTATTMMTRWKKNEIRNLCRSSTCRSVKTNTQPMPLVVEDDDDDDTEKRRRRVRDLQPPARLSAAC
jgi:DNA-binding transcriptional MerR regulator